MEVNSLASSSMNAVPKLHMYQSNRTLTQCILPEVGVVIVHVGLDRGTKKVSASGVFRVFTSLLRDSLIKKGLLYAYSWQ